MWMVMMVAIRESLRELKLTKGARGPVCFETQIIR